MSQWPGWAGACSSGLQISIASKDTGIMSPYLFTFPNDTLDLGGKGSALAGTGFFLHLGKKLRQLQSKGREPKQGPEGREGKRLR